MPDFKKQYRAFLKAVKKDLQDQMSRKGLNATGLGSSSLRVVANQNLVGELRGLFYLGYLQEGEGVKPDGISRKFVNKIKLWMQAKGIHPRDGNTLTRSAFAIAATIADRGTKIWQGRGKTLDIDGAIERHAEDFAENIGDSYLVDFENRLTIR